MNLVELFCHVDDFCQAFEAHWIGHQVTPVVVVVVVLVNSV